MIIKQQTYNAGIYCRLSAEDNLAGKRAKLIKVNTLAGFTRPTAANIVPLTTSLMIIFITS